MGWEMVIQGSAGTGDEGPVMDADEFVVAVDADQVGRGLEPEGLSDEGVGHGVEAPGILDMSIAVDLELGPGGEFRWLGGQRAEEGLLRGEPGQGPLCGGAVDAVAGIGEDPLVELGIGILEAAELTGGYEGSLEVLDAGFHTPFLLRVPPGTGIDTEGAIVVLYRGSITPLYHPLCTLHDVRCRTPCNTRSRSVGCTFSGQESNLLDCDKWFPLCHNFLHLRTSPSAMKIYNASALHAKLCRQPCIQTPSISANRHMTFQG